ncbi:MAG: nucleotide-diphospho-sugar transferase [Spirochaetaceae bacterium]|nr:nucleotide-diphospho-sugar transferase [Spirochaetaceae bacterium]
MDSFNIPILLLIFNRLDTTKQVFEVIRKVSPKRLYVASDGPRDSRAGEDEKVKAIREYILNSIDWDCEVKTLFREKNLGCGRAPSQAITWFFENEEMGIILEDDCVPALSFFSYCEELLNKYKDDTRIYHIAGNNPLICTKIPYSYYFSRIQQCWGWATWRRAWEKYSFYINDLNDFIKHKKINAIFTRSVDRYYWLQMFKNMKKEQYRNDIWDSQWTYAILNNDGMCINPAKNLITNIGFGIDATHTIAADSNFNNQQRYEISDILHPDKIAIDNKNIILINKSAFGIKWNYIIKQIIRKVLGFIKKLVIKQI